MLTAISKIKMSYYAALLLLAWLSIAPAIVNSFTFPLKSETHATIVTQTPCSKARTAQVIKLCQLAKLQFYMDSSYLFTLFQSAAGRFIFVYLSGLIATGFLTRIFKPPKYTFAFC